MKLGKMLDQPNARIAFGVKEIGVIHCNRAATT